MLLLTACSSGAATAAKYGKVPAKFCAVLDFGMMAEKLGPLDYESKETARDGENPSHTCDVSTTGAEISKVTIMIVIYPSAELTRRAFATTAADQAGYPTGQELGLEYHEWSNAGPLLKLRGIDSNLMLAVNVIGSAGTSQEDAVDVVKDLTAQILARMPTTGDSPISSDVAGRKLTS